MPPGPEFEHEPSPLPWPSISLFLSRETLSTGPLGSHCSVTRGNRYGDRTPRCPQTMMSFPLMTERRASRLQSGTSGMLAGLFTALPEPEAATCAAMSNVRTCTASPSPGRLTNLSVITSGLSLEHLPSLLPFRMLITRPPSGGA